MDIEKIEKTENNCNSRGSLRERRAGMKATPLFRPGILLGMLAALLSFGAACAADDDDEAARAWNWMPIEGAICRDGSPTGIGVRRAPSSEDSDKLLFYLQGGGACFNDATCATNPSSFGEAQFIGWTLNGLSGIFNEENSGNPFRGWNKVFVPYCTGDVHGGNQDTAQMVPYDADLDGDGDPRTSTLQPDPTMSGYDPAAPAEPQNFVGYKNMGLITTAVITYFENAGIGEVLLTGSSAGGFGTLVNYDRVKQAFGDGVAVTGLSDAGPIFDDYTPEDDPATASGEKLVARDCSYAITNNLWDTKFPDDYSDHVDADDWVADESAGLYSYYSSKYPDQQFGLLSHLQDSTIRFFYGLANVTADVVDSVAVAGGGSAECTSLGGYTGDGAIEGNLYEEALIDLRNNHFANDGDRSNWKVYYRGSETEDTEGYDIEEYHTFLQSNNQFNCDPNLIGWISDLRAGEAEHTLSEVTAASCPE